MDFIRENWNLIFGIVLAAVAIGMIVKSAYDRKKGIRCKGVIVGFSKGERDYLFPVVQFTYEGEEYCISTMNGSKKPKKGVGSEMEILYLPKNQKYVIEVGNYNDIWVSLACAVAGIALILSGLLG